MKLALVMIITLTIAMVALPAGAQLVTVDAAGGGDCLTIQEGLDASSDGGTVLVVAGTYTGDGNRDLDFGTKNLTLESQSGAAATIIDNEGEGGHRLFSFYNSDQDTTCVIDGFTIQGGRFVQAGSPGGGIKIDGSGSGTPSPKFVNCVIRSNHSYGGSGGGVYAANYCNPIFENCTFESNTALSSGGGLYCSMYSPAIVRNCTFTNNQCSTGFGGGMACNNWCDAVVRTAWFEGNTSGDQGGALGCYRSDPVVDDVVFLNNLATTSGGAVYAQISSPNFTNCTFVKNRSLGEGSIYYAWASSSPAFDKCIFAFSPEDGASTFYCEEGSTPTIHYCLSFANPDGNDVCGSIDGIIFEDPLFCDITEDDLTLAANSPCMPSPPRNPWGVALGALGQGCTLSPVQARSWGT
ncbi:right-handed parallel beta-helix repeat-containing protein, partial [bacterium]|nr:right-handed parallel beta-helix repeat-containing protein [bacterium]